MNRFNRNHANLFVAVILSAGLALGVVILTGEIISLIKKLF